MIKNKTDYSWLKKHKQLLTVHTLILSVAILYFIFGAEEVQDKLESIPNESKVQNISIPAATNNIIYFIDQFDTTQYKLEIQGWAFIEGESCEDCQTFLVLKSADRSYVFNTKLVIREGVTTAFKKSGLNLDRSGFLCVVPMKNIADGKYNVGILIRKSNIVALQYTNKDITK